MVQINIDELRAKNAEMILIAEDYVQTRRMIALIEQRTTIREESNRLQAEFDQLELEFDQFTRMIIDNDENLTPEQGDRYNEIGLRMQQIDRIIRRLNNRL
jgi:hypothetical protein